MVERIQEGYGYNRGDFREFRGWDEARVGEVEENEGDYLGGILEID